MRKKVYNLEFPSWCQELTVFGYRFTRVEDYKEKYLSLQRIVEGSDSEFSIKANTGQHAHTAYVELPKNEEEPVLEWADKKVTALDDGDVHSWNTL